MLASDIKYIHRGYLATASSYNLSLSKEEQQGALELCSQILNHLLSESAWDAHKLRSLSTSQLGDYIFHAHTDYSYLEQEYEALTEQRQIVAKLVWRFAE